MLVLCSALRTLLHESQLLAVPCLRSMAHSVISTACLPAPCLPCTHLPRRDLLHPIGCGHF
jgi:hypothetical protein